MRKTSIETIEKLKNLLIEVYERSQQPVLTTELWKGSTVNGIYGDFGLGKNYTLDSFLKGGALRIVEVFSPQKKTVVWDAGYPDMDLAQRVQDNKIETKKRKTVTTLTETETEQVEVEEAVTSLIDINEIVEKFHPEYLDYRPTNGTVPNVEKMLKVLKYNAKDRYCHKDQLFCLAHPNEEGEIITVDYRAAHKYSLKRLVDLQIIERNPENNSEYRFVAQFDDMQEFARQLAFTTNYLTNRTLLEETRNARLNPTPAIEKVEEEMTQTEEAVAETIRSNRSQDSNIEKDLEIQRLTKLYSLIRTENKKMFQENQENMRLLREATEKLTQVALKLDKNNGISNHE